MLILIALQADVGGLLRMAALPGSAAGAEPAGRAGGRRHWRLGDGQGRRPLWHPPRLSGALRPRAGARRFAAGQAVQGDGFLTAFFAGLAVTLFNVSLCDFLEYGEVTAEMAMLLAFVLFGAVLSSLGTVALLPALMLAF